MEFYPTIAYMKRRRHPRFNIYFSKHEKFIWSIAYKLAKKTHQNSAEDFIAFITLKLNECLFSYKKDMGAFTTYLMRACITGYRDQLMKYESEQNKFDTYMFRSSRNQSKPYLNLVELDSEMEKSILEEKNDIWDVIRPHLTLTQYSILYHEYVLGYNLKQIANILKRCHQRICFNRKQAICKLQSLVQSNRLQLV